MGRSREWGGLWEGVTSALKIEGESEDGWNGCEEEGN